MLRWPPRDGVIETSLPPAAMVPPRENVFSAGMFPRVSLSLARLSGVAGRVARADRMAKLTQGIAGAREPHRCRRLREFGASKQLLTSTGMVGTRAAPTRGTGQTIRIAGCK